MNKKRLLVFGLLLAVTFIVVSYLRKDAPRQYHIVGQTMGTIIYNVKYVGVEAEGLDLEIEDELVQFNQSLSTYIPDSEISRLNRDGELSFESKYFKPILDRSAEIYEKTYGTFDPTIGPLVQAWGFGPDKKIPDLDSAQVDSLLRVVGFDKVQYDELSVRLPEGFEIDFSAIAKGYAVDVVAELLEQRGITDYMVEIGGEVRCRGVNESDKSWSLGIEDPTVFGLDQQIMAIVRLKDLSLATSGNYRNYYVEDGQTFAHIIDPRSGFNAKHNLLSASVFSSDCMTADAYATSFMVLGLEFSKKIIEANDLEAILIYRLDEGVSSYVSDGIRPFVELNKADKN